MRLWHFLRRIDELISFQANTLDLAPVDHGNGCIWKVADLTLAYLGISLQSVVSCSNCSPKVPALREKNG
jgi:hypothetical protein